MAVVCSHTLVIPASRKPRRKMVVAVSRKCDCRAQDSFNTKQNKVLREDALKHGLTKSVGKMAERSPAWAMVNPCTLSCCLSASRLQTQKSLLPCQHQPQGNEPAPGAPTETGYCGIGPALGALAPRMEPCSYSQYCLPYWEARSSGHHATKHKGQA